MPRKLLRVALVAAVFPALAPEIVSAQTAAFAPTVRTAAPAASQAATPKKGLSGWWQRVRGQKPAVAPAATAGKIVKVSAERPAQQSTAKAEQPFDMEGNADVQLLRRSSGRQRPNFNETATPATPTPAAPAPVVSQPAPQTSRSDFDNVFPDDAPRGRRSPATSQDVATPVEPDAYPIEAAAPPADVTAGYNALQGAVPQYDRAGLITPDAAATPADDVNFAKPIPARPSGMIHNGMNGGTPAVQSPPAVIYGAPGMARVDAALYPSPQPGIPFHVGSTMITNPAFDPHEMLYAHRYRGLYGPFYHKTCRHWILTPFGICKSEKRILMGTEVRVNYKTHISPFALYWPPVGN